MTQRLRLRRPMLWIVLLCAGVSGASGAAAITSQQCENQVNDTPSKLVECIQKDDLWSYMQDFQAIADAHPGPDGHPSRNSGEPGYKASVDYVAGLMTQWGYDVKIQTYQIPYFSYVGVPVMKEVSPTPHDYQVGFAWNPGPAQGDANAELQPAGGIVIPPTPTSSSTSGCTAADFSGFVSGRVALIQRGGCNFGVKVLNAVAAGATGVIIFNEGNPGRTGPLLGSLLDANGNPINATVPVAFTPFAVASNSNPPNPPDTPPGLYDQYQAAVQAGTALVMNMSVHAITETRDDYNVIADSIGGNANRTVVIDAHLDAIYGAGMLDNASGSVTILDIARMMKNVNPLNHLRFIWFGGEELGLLGSQYYVANLSPSELSHIGYDLDADVTATPNYVVGVLDPAGPDLFGGTSTQTFPNRVYKASTVARDQMTSYFDSIGKNHVFFSPVGTDAYSFNIVGIPASGALTGQDCCKNLAEVDLFGGYLGNFEGNIPSFDGGCVDQPFRWCDNLSNNDPNVLEFMSKGFAGSVVKMAFDNKVMSASGGGAVFQPKLPISAKDTRHVVSR